MAGNAVESGRTVTSKVTAIIMAFADGTGWSLSELARDVEQPSVSRAAGRVLPTKATPEAMGDLGAAAHKLVALAGMLGFTDLADQCRHLDAACEETFEGVQEALDRVTAAAGEALRTIAVLEQTPEQVFGAAA